MSEHIIKFKKDFMDPISDTFCSAKWFEGTIWLYAQQTASCHHNPYHTIVVDHDDPSSIYNTLEKKVQRKEMLNGEKPAGCEYCWKTERVTALSDRVLKTLGTEAGHRRLIEWTKNTKDIPLSVTPTNLEIAFSRTCNLACAYCRPMFSSTWEADIAVNGSYNLLKDKSYNEVAVERSPGKVNPTMDAFWKWWPSLETELLHLKITGGEPMLSSEFWNLIELLRVSELFNGQITINTNLVQPLDKVVCLIDKLKDRDVIISTSIESGLQDTEYSRDGFESNVWMSNIHYILKNSNAHVRLSTAFNNLTVWTADEYLQIAEDLKREYGATRISVNCNLVQSPECMQVQLIPKDKRSVIAHNVSKFLDVELFTEYDILHIKRLVSVLCDSEFAPWSNCTTEEAINDLKIFIREFDRRRAKNYRTGLSASFVNWIEG